jgi:hypothetical protein
VAFYRVTIWTIAGKVLQGIRELENSNIDYATNFFRGQAVKSLGQLADIEVAMLSNKCTAVWEFIEEREKRKARQAWREAAPPTIHARRREGYSGSGTPIG